MSIYSLHIRTQLSIECSESGFDVLYPRYTPNGETNKSTESQLGERRVKEVAEMFRSTGKNTISIRIAVSILVVVQW